ncbi:MAG: BrxE family protein [Bryobacteraceae bacterium]
MSLRADHLFKCRVVVARLGEMDRAGARWWNTAGLLSSVGVSALKRNFPYTHWFAQARAVIAVAGARSSEVFPLPKSCVSLWSFPPDVEVRLSEEWPQWIANETDWRPFFEKVSELSGLSVTGALQEMGLAQDPDIQFVESLKRSHEGKAVLVPTREPLDDTAVIRLALGFSHGELGKLAVPYMRLAGGQE